MAASRMLRTGLVVLATAALTIGALAGGAAASRRIDTPSRISIKSTELRFTGRVTAKSYPSCEGSRKVVLYKVVHNGPDEPVGQTTTDVRGYWSVTVSGFAGVSLTSFYAKVGRSSQGAAGTIYVCDPAKSRTIKPAS